MEVDVVNSLKQGNDALKKMNEILKLEDIEKLMEDSREAAEYQNVGSAPLFVFSVTDAAILSRKSPIFCRAA